MGPQPLQIKQNTGSFKMPAFNSLQLFLLRASPSVRGEGNTWPVLREERAVGRGKPPPQIPSLARRVGKAWAMPGPSLVSCAAQIIFVTRGKVVLRGFRVWGGNFCAPTGDIACQLLTGVGAAAAPPNLARALGHSHSLSSRPAQTDGSRLCSDILETIGEARPGSRPPPSW